MAITTDLYIHADAAGWGQNVTNLLNLYYPANWQEVSPEAHEHYREMVRQVSTIVEKTFRESFADGVPESIDVIGLRKKRLFVVLTLALLKEMEPAGLAGETAKVMSTLEGTASEINKATKAWLMGPLGFCEWRQLELSQDEQRALNGAVRDSIATQAEVMFKRNNLLLDLPDELVTTLHEARSINTAMEQLGVSLDPKETNPHVTLVHSAEAERAYALLQSVADESVDALLAPITDRFREKIAEATDLVEGVSLGFGPDYPPNRQVAVLQLSMNEAIADLFMEFNALLDAHSNSPDWNLQPPKTPHITFRCDWRDRSTAIPAEAAEKIPATWELLLETAIANMPEIERIRDSFTP